MANPLVGRCDTGLEPIPYSLLVHQIILSNKSPCAESTIYICESLVTPHFLSYITTLKPKHQHLIAPQTPPNPFPNNVPYQKPPKYTTYSVLFHPPAGGCPGTVWPQQHPLFTHWHAPVKPCSQSQPTNHKLHLTIHPDKYRWAGMIRGKPKKLHLHYTDTRRKQCELCLQHRCLRG